MAAILVSVHSGWRRVVLERGVFGGQAEGVPAHGVQHVVAAHPHEAGERVADGVVAHMAHVQLAAGIGQHLQAIELGLAAVVALGGIERRTGVPARLPFGFNLSGVVALLPFTGLCTDSSILMIVKKSATGGCYCISIQGHPPPPPPYGKVSETIEFQTFVCKVPPLNELDTKYKKIKATIERPGVLYSSNPSLRIAGWA